MKNFINKIRNNKILAFIGNLLYSAMFIVVTLMLIVVILQRTSDNTVALGGYRMFNVATGSMVPKYEVGDVLLAKEINPDELKIGDDIVYKGKEGSFKDKIVTHRIISKNFIDGHYKIVTKGIANDIEDPEINETQIIGRVVYKIKTLSYLGQMMKNIYVFYFIIFLPIVVLVFKQIYNLMHPEEDDDEEDSKVKNKNKNKNQNKSKNNNKKKTTKEKSETKEKQLKENKDKIIDKKENKTNGKEKITKSKETRRVVINKEENEKLKNEIRNKIQEEIEDKK